VYQDPAGRQQATVEREGIRVLLELDQISVRFRNGALGVKDLSMSIEKGSVVALFGPNGAGKTTTVRAVSGFLRSEGARVASGGVRFNGMDIANWEPHRVARTGIAYVAERNKVFKNLTVRENLIALGNLPAKAEREATTERVFEMFPVLAERRGTQAGRLSGGQQQMLALGRALLNSPQLLIVDEMTLGLHHSMQPVLFDAITRIVADGTTVILVEESTGLALELADYCYLLYGGSLRDEGPASKYRGNELLVAGYVGDPA
jgi:ABC-type branched-subunit amino acid transport system ATPase component